MSAEKTLFKNLKLRIAEIDETLMPSILRAMAEHAYNEVRDDNFTKAFEPNNDVKSDCVDPCIKNGKSDRFCLSCATELSEPLFGKLSQRYKELTHINDVLQAMEDDGWAVSHFSVQEKVFLRALINMSYKLDAAT